MTNYGFSKLGERTQAPPIAWLMEAPLQRPNLISLAAGFTDNASLPVAEAREIAEEIFSNDTTARQSLQYGTTAGNEALRQATVERLKTFDQPAPEATSHYSVANAVITHGSQQFLYLLMECLFDEGDIVLVEDPTYFVFLGMAQSRGIQCRGIRTQGDGIDTAHLTEVLSELKSQNELHRVKALYIVSYCQNPSGVSTSLEKKRKTLGILQSFEASADHRLYLIEDAAYRELTFPNMSQIPTGLSLPEAGDRLLFTSTYSKPFATGIRVGYGLLPEPLLTVFKRIKSNHDFGTSHFLQQVILKALTSQRYAKHQQMLANRYADKADCMRSAMKEHFPEGCRWLEPVGGLYFWASLPEHIDTGMKSDFFTHALENDVLYVPGALCYCADSSRVIPSHEMRISFGNASEEQIHEGIRRLGQTMRKFLKS